MLLAIVGVIGIPYSPYIIRKNLTTLFSYEDPYTRFLSDST